MVTRLLRFELDGHPYAKARARSRKGRKAWTPENTVDFEYAVSIAARQALNGESLPQDCSYSIAVVIYGSPGIGDGDNILKSVADGLQKHELIPNDKYVYRSIPSLVPVNKKEDEKIVVAIFKWPDDALDEWFAKYVFPEVL